MRSAAGEAGSKARIRDNVMSRSESENVNPIIEPVMRELRLIRSELASLRGQQQSYLSAVDEDFVARRETFINQLNGGFIEAKEAAQLFSICKNTWFNWRKSGLISAGVSLGHNKIAWPREEIIALYDQICSGKLKIRS